MSYAHITIDGNTIIDRDGLSPTQPAAPQEITQLLKPGTTPQPGVLAVLSAFGFAIKAGQDITAHLRNRATGYDLTVDHARIIESQDT